MCTRCLLHLRRRRLCRLTSLRSGRTPSPWRAVRSRPQQVPAALLRVSSFHRRRCRQRRPRLALWPPRWRLLVLRRRHLPVARRRHPLTRRWRRRLRTDRRLAVQSCPASARHCTGREGASPARSSTPRVARTERCVRFATSAKQAKRRGGSRRRSPIARALHTRRVAREACGASRFFSGCHKSM